MDEQRIAEIKARLDAATPGPWQTRFLHRVYRAARYDPDLLFGNPLEQDWPDCDFMAHARSDVPALLVALKEERDRTLETAAVIFENIEPDLMGHEWLLEVSEIARKLRRMKSDMSLPRRPISDFAEDLWNSAQCFMDHDEDCPQREWSATEPKCTCGFANFEDKLSEYLSKKPVPTAEYTEMKERAEAAEAKLAEITAATAESLAKFDDLSAQIAGQLPALGFNRLRQLVWSKPVPPNLAKAAARMATAFKPEVERCNCDASCGENRYHNRGDEGCMHKVKP